VRAFKSVGATPIFVERAKGAHIEDVDGHTYIDYVMSWGPLIHGHAPKGLIKALGAAAARGTSFGAPTELETRLARKVAMLVPSMERVRFVSSGTEAAMSALRVARAATKRDKIIKFEGCYHGHADAFLVQAGSGAMTLGVPTSPGVPAVVAADTLLARYNDLDSVERIFKAHRAAIAAVFVEPIAGNMGLVPPAGGFLQGLRQLCDRERSLLVFDEVISGFRAAPGGAQKVFGVKPDMTCLGKIIGGGLPVGAYGGRADVMALVAPSGPVYQAGTLSGNPLAMTAGLWSLSELSKGLYQHMAKLASRLAAGLAESARDAGVALQVNAFGSLLTPFFTTAPVRDYQSALAADTAAYGRFFRAMLEAGIYPPPSQFEAWFLSGAHTRKDVDATIKASRKAMKAVAAG
jgi:glutamate-1-semialdehyde 2,1-aminomutase